MKLAIIVGEKSLLLRILGIAPKLLSERIYFQSYLLGFLPESTHFGRLAALVSVLSNGPRSTCRWQRKTACHQPEARPTPGMSKKSPISHLINNLWIAL